MPKPKRVIAIMAPAAALIVAATAWHQAAAQEIAPDAEACFARPTVTCAVEMALVASAGSTDAGDDLDRAQLLVRTAYRLKEIGARKALLDRAASRFFSGSTFVDRYVDRERRTVDIAAAILDGDDAHADRRLGEVRDFQLWWQTLGDVIDILAKAGRPDLAVALEARYRSTETVDITDALGRDLGKQVWDTRQLLARALVGCDCGPDPLPIALDLPGQVDRLDLTLPLYARRHDVEGLMALLTREFGNLAEIEDETQRNWVGYAYGLMARELPLHDVPAFLGKRPEWLTAWHFKRPDSGRIYANALARAVEAGDRAAVAALVELQARDDIVWLSAGAISAPDAAAKVADLLPKLERDNLLLIRTKLLIERGDARKAVDELMNSPAADVWREPELDPGDDASFDVFVLEPLLASGAFDAAEEAVRHLGEKDAREGKLERIAIARKEGVTGTEPKGAAAMLADHWTAYQQAKGSPDAGRSFLRAVRDLIRSQPDAFPID